jgi:hypothetical protein
VVSGADLPCQERRNILRYRELGRKSGSRENKNKFSLDLRRAHAIIDCVGTILNAKQETTMNTKNTTVKTYEVYNKVLVKGTFFTQEAVKIVDHVQAHTVEEATVVARQMHGKGAYVALIID